MPARKSRMQDAQDAVARNLSADIAGAGGGIAVDGIVRTIGRERCERDECCRRQRPEQGREKLLWVAATRARKRKVVVGR
jgi:hypothetical protein